MNYDFLKQAEIFAFLAIFFLIGVLFSSSQKPKEETEVITTPTCPACAECAPCPLCPRCYQKPCICPIPENPPIIVLSEKNQSYRFELGSADIPQAFEAALQNKIVPLLDSLAKQYQCDTIEVIGHTDGVPIQRQGAQFDQNLVKAFNQHNIEKLIPNSNMDLGVMRALNIVILLQEIQNKSSYLKEIQYFHPYSAGPIILPDKTLAQAENDQPDQSRRRIEIRILQSGVRKIE